MKMWLALILTIAMAGVLVGTVIIPVIAQGGGSQTAVPDTISYQGYLTNSGGIPIDANSLSIKFSLWDKKDVVTDSVSDEEMFLTGTASRSLDHQNLVDGSEIVTGISGSPTYQSPRDYAINYSNGTISRIAAGQGGFIPNGSTVEIDYNWIDFGNLIWSETQLVDVSNGLFSVELGTIGSPMSAAILNGDRFLGICVDGDDEMAPRQEISSVAYAFIAEYANASNSSYSLSAPDGDPAAAVYVDNDGKVGIGTSTPAAELEVVGGISSLPGQLTHAGAITNSGTTALNGATSICVFGKYAYVTSVLDNGVEILDISDPSNPSHVGAIVDSGTTVLSGARSIFVTGNYAYVVGDEGGMEILDITNPGSPVHAGSISDNSTTVLGGSNDIYVSGNYAYIASYYEHGVEILDISNPGSPAHAGSITDNSTTALAGAEGIYVSGKYAYVTSKLDSGVEILDVSQPGTPVHVGAITDNSTTALAGAEGIYVSGKYAYVASSGDNGVEILDISDPGSPTHAGAIFDNSSTALLGAKDIWVSGKYAYVASSGDNGVEVLDISDPGSPAHVSAIFDSGPTELSGAAGICISGKYAYVASVSDSGVEILDIGGLDAPAANIGDIAASSVTVSENVGVSNSLYVGNSLSIGAGGINSAGPVSVTDVFSITPRSGAPSGRLGDLYVDVYMGLCFYDGVSWRQVFPPAVDMVSIAGGTFSMGCTNTPCETNETPVHTVTLSPFLMAKHEVNYAQWREVKNWAEDNGYVFEKPGTLGSEGYGAETQPVTEIVWWDAALWCNALSEKEGLNPCYYTSAAKTAVSRSQGADIQNDWVDWNADGYRLPTEAEWEYACRSGTTSRYYVGDTLTGSNANYENSGDIFDNRTTPAGYYQANPWGLHDMHGNVSEWCWDRYDSYSSGSSTDPRGPLTGSYRVMRDGSYYQPGTSSRAAIRSADEHGGNFVDTGFRPVRSG